MKTAVSIPDDIFQAADDLAHRLAVSRSELYARALADFVAHHGSAGVTERLNEVYGETEVNSALDPVVAKMQVASLPREPR